MQGFDAVRLWPILLGLIAGLLALIAGYAHGVVPHEGWRLAARFTARASVVMFAMPYLISSIARYNYTETTRDLLRDRRFWGLGFAITHTIHLIAVANFIRGSIEPPATATLVGGGIAYVLLYLMVLTSFDRARELLGQGWVWLHRIGINYLWLIFLITFGSKIANPNTRAAGAVFTFLVLAMLGFKLYVRTLPPMPRRVKR